MKKLICKFCGAKDVMGLRQLQSPHDAAKYTLYECSVCHQRFFDMDEHEASREVLQKIYDNLAERNEKLYPLAFTPSRYWRHEVKCIKNYTTVR